MRPQVFTISPAVSDDNGLVTAATPGAAINMDLGGALCAGHDRNGICTAQTPTAAGDMTINGALASGNTVVVSVARRVIIYSDGDDSGVTFTIAGLDADEKPLTEAVTGPNATQAESSGEFLVITSVTISAAGTGNIEVGMVGVGTIAEPCHILITSDGDDSGVTFTITGKDRNGFTISEAITGPNATTAAGAKNFAEVRTVRISAAGTGSIEVGTADALESAWIPVDFKGGYLGASVNLSSDANFTYSLQHTYESVQEGYVEGGAAAFDSLLLEDATASGFDSYDAPPAAVRLEITSYVAGSVELALTQVRS